MHFAFFLYTFKRILLTSFKCLFVRDIISINRVALNVPSYDKSFALRSLPGRAQRAAEAWLFFAMYLRLSQKKALALAALIIQQQKQSTMTSLCA